MGSSLSEPCIYDKLSESIDILRQSGYRYGMSEREIEKFIKQVLETNEPRRDPPQFPILRATVKFLVAVGVLLMAVLAFTYPQSSSLLGPLSVAGHNWSSPLSHVRLLSLPIAKKYNLHGFHEWWATDVLQTAQVNCSTCADVTAVLELTDSLSESVVMHRETQPVLLKGGESVSQRVSELEQFSSYNSRFTSVSRPDTFMQTPANFTLLWSFSSSRRETVLQWLFPDAELCPLLDNTGTTLQHCQLTDNTSYQSMKMQVLGWLVVADGSPVVRILPVQQCQKHCSSFNLWLEPGDIVYADPRYWLMELFPGESQNIVCDGPVL
ncbi:bombesin receptor-activated protein C6orf89 homolog [Xyrauchen texanus]|uniref:bombesin receptor-activated protein C6orf89 homolog n=1 Tax=Xyrauchen texanus TaxID=154827 RepID=UPI002242A14A|nr:bombesin receptor-activated protein C6orf89 homolog [Xyrauchen texanus]XP_051979963.1 bombesin receptor-activated protein C6orf89 homolog [Xyrauchen texanus]